jgi:hypothetical protein
MQPRQGISSLPGLKNQICGRKKFTTKAKKAHEAQRQKAVIHSLCVPWCAFVVYIPVPGSFAYPVMQPKQGISSLPGLKISYADGGNSPRRRRRRTKLNDRRPSYIPFVFLGAPSWLKFLFPVPLLIR